MSRFRFRRRSVILAASLVLLVVADGLLLWRRSRYREEIDRLRAGMTAIERQRADAIVAADNDKATLMLELMRRQSQGDDAIHLAVNTDSGFVALERGAARLRVMPAEVGPERRVGTPPDTQHVVVPRGMRSIERLLGDSDQFVLPAWVWADRGQSAPDQRAGPGWTGPAAIITTGGTLLYSRPSSGPLADSAYVMPGAIRLAARDLRAIRENLVPGTRVYFF